MPASTRKDRSTLIAVREVPTHLSKEVFESKVKALLESLMTIPVVKKNYVTFELVSLVLLHWKPPSLTRARQLLETPLLNTDIRALGFPEARPFVIALIECEVSMVLSLLA